MQIQYEPTEDDIIKKIVELKHKRANLLGFDNFALINYFTFWDFSALQKVTY